MICPSGETAGDLRQSILVGFQKKNETDTTRGADRLTVSLVGLQSHVQDRRVK